MGQQQPAVGVIGLGQMGGAMAANLVDAGFEVHGRDIDPQRVAACERAGARAAASPAEVAARAGVVITSLPSSAAFLEVLTGPGGIVPAGHAVTVVETSTLPLEVKIQGLQATEGTPVVLLDCPLSGTGAQALTRDLAVYASGDRDAISDCAPVFDGFARAHFDVGEFGNGSKMKYLANLLVTIHNLSAAEAMVLGRKAGLDPDQIVEVIGGGAGTSRMFDVRAPMMAARDYDGAGIQVRTFAKDVAIIGEFARSLDCPVPLFAASTAFYAAAAAQGLGEMDTAAVCEVLERMAGTRE